MRPGADQPIEERIPARQVRGLEVDLGISPRMANYLVRWGIFSGGNRGRRSTYPVRAITQRQVYALLPRMLAPADLRHQLWWVHGVPLGDWNLYRVQLAGVAQDQRDLIKALRRHRRRRPQEDLAAAAGRMLEHYRDPGHPESRHRRPLGLGQLQSREEQDQALGTAAQLALGEPVDEQRLNLLAALWPPEALAEIGGLQTLSGGLLPVWSFTVSGLEHVGEEDAWPARDFRAALVSRGFDPMITDAVIVAALAIGSIAAIKRGNLGALLSPGERVWSAEMPFPKAGSDRKSGPDAQAAASRPHEEVADDTANPTG